jgi:hypothetical protein
MRRLPVSLVLILAALASAVIVAQALATPPSDAGFPRPAPCLGPANTTGGASVCAVNPFGDVPWKASTGEWVVIALGNQFFDDPVSEGGSGSLAQALADCQAFKAAVVTHIYLDGKSRSIDVIGCSLTADAHGYQVDTRTLVSPLKAGAHTFSATWANVADAGTFGPHTLTVVSRP